MRKNKMKSKNKLGIKFLSVFVPRKKIKITKDNIAPVLKEHFSNLGYIDRECMWVVMLNDSCHLLGIDLVSVGSDNQTRFTAKELFRRSILKGASNLIVVHNHPALSTEPSKEDKEILGIIVKMAATLGMQIEASVIISGDEVRVMLVKKEEKKP